MPARMSQTTALIKTSRFRREQERIEHALVRRYLIACGGNMCAAARLMGIDRQNLLRHIRKHQLEAFTAACRKKAVNTGRKFLATGDVVLSEITEVMLTDILEDVRDEAPPLPIPEPPVLPPLRVAGLFASGPVAEDAAPVAEDAVPVEAVETVEAVEAPHEPISHGTKVPEEHQLADEFSDYDEDSEDETDADER